MTVEGRRGPLLFPSTQTPCCWIRSACFRRTPKFRPWPDMRYAPRRAACWSGARSRMYVSYRSETRGTHDPEQEGEFAMKEIRRGEHEKEQIILTKSETLSIRALRLSFQLFQNFRKNWFFPTCNSTNLKHSDELFLFQNTFTNVPLFFSTNIQGTRFFFL